MSRLALTLVVGFVWAMPSLAENPHVNPSHLPGGCSSCHAGHGDPGSRMLPGPQRDVCLRCHGTQAKLDLEIDKGNLASTSRPTLLEAVLELPFRHPTGDDSSSKKGVEGAACTSCHSPHRSPANRTLGSSALPGRKVSGRDPSKLEYETCQTCHGNQGVKTQDREDLSRLLSPNNPSFHPVEAPAISRSPSLPMEMSGKTINCTDCHGNSDPDGPRGVHGSSVRYLLSEQYSTTDGVPESPDTYALCYDCHDREVVLNSRRFPEHRSHVISAMASCATCHDPHGSPDNRALIRIAKDTKLTGISPSISTGILAFESAVPGSGSCSLTCHGFDHAPESYGIPGRSRPATDPASRLGGKIPAQHPPRR